MAVEGSSVGRIQTVLSFSNCVRGGVGGGSLVLTAPMLPLADLGQPCRSCGCSRAGTNIGRVQHWGGKGGICALMAADMASGENPCDC